MFGVLYNMDGVERGSTAVLSKALAYHTIDYVWSYYSIYISGKGVILTFVPPELGITC